MNPREEFLSPNTIHMVVDARAQRPLKTARVNELVRSYDPESLGVIHLSERADCYHVLDGQHRLSALIKLGLGDVPVRCLVYSGLSLADEARRFNGLNKVYLVGAIDKFRTLVTAGDPECTQISTLLARHGLSVGAYHSNGIVSAVVALRSVFTKGGPALLNRTLSVLKGAWGLDRDAYDGVLLKGTSALLLEHGETVDTKRLAHVLSKHGTAASVRGEIVAYKKVAGKTDALAGRAVLTAIYNRSLRGNRRLPE